MRNAHRAVDIKDILLICLIAVIAITLRFFYFQDYRTSDVYPIVSYSDAYYYDVWAHDIAAGDFLGSKVFMKWPLYAYVVALWYGVSGHSILFVYLMQSMLGVLHCILIYSIAKYLFNRSIACISALLCAWYAFFIFYDYLLIYTSLSLFLNALFFLTLLLIQERPLPLRVWWAGLLLGVCTLVQANILLCGIASMIWILWQKRFSISQRSVWLCIFFTPVFLLLGTTAIRNYMVAQDRVLLTAHTGVNFFLGNNPEANGLFHCPEYISANQEGMFRDAEVLARVVSQRPLKPSQVNAFWFQRSGEFIRNNPRAFIDLLKRKAVYLFSGEEFVHDAEYPLIKGKVRVLKYMLTDLKFILPFALLGMLLGIRRVRQTGLLYCMSIAISISILPFFVTTRYRIMEVPFLIIFAAFGVWSMWEALRQKQYVKLGVLYLGVILFFILCNRNSLIRSRDAYRGSDSEKFDTALRNAIQLTSKSDYTDAMNEALKATALKPQSPRSIFALAVAQFHAGEFSQAEANFNLVIEMLPFSVDALYNLGVLYYRQHRFSQAQEALSRAVFLDPDDVSAHFELARAYKGAGKSEEAKKEYKVALQKINPWRMKEITQIKQELSQVSP